MNLSLALAFLFFIGSVLGWVLELFFRRFVSAANPERKWINPGFCIGPYLPMYGVGLCILFLLACMEEWHLVKHEIWNRVVLFLAMAVLMTVIEYIAGLLALKVAKVRLWDYRKEWGNVQGIICPRFSAAWALLGAAYYFLIHPHILDALAWLSNNLAFSFVIGLFFGVFLIDVIYSSQLLLKLRQFAKEYDVIVKYENLKTHIRQARDKRREKAHFFFPLRSERALSEHLKDMLDSLERRAKKPRIQNKK